MTFIPTLSLDGEWQGTIIVNRYDEYGNFLEQYVADIVMIQQREEPYTWAAVYEVEFIGGTPYLNHEPDMYTGFGLGTSIQEHQTRFGTPPPLDLEQWQFSSPQQEQQYYETYPEQQQFQREQPAYRTEQQISLWGRAVIRQASFQIRSDRAIERHQLRPCNPCRDLIGSGARRYLACVGFAVAGASLSCWAFGPFTANCVGGRTVMGLVTCASNFFF